MNRNIRIIVICIGIVFFTSAHPKENVLFGVKDSATIKSLFDGKFNFDKYDHESWLGDNAISHDEVVHRRNILVATAINYGIDLSSLSDYGLEKMPDGSYSVNLQEYPDWMTLSDLFSWYKEKELLDNNIENLKIRGFSDIDAIIFETYVNKNDAEIAKIRGILEFLKENGRIYKELFKSDSSVVDFYKFIHGIHDAERQALIKWCNGLINEFDVRAQRVLISYALEDVGRRTYFPDLKNYLHNKEEFINAFVSGGWERSMLQQINLSSEKDI